MPCLCRSYAHYRNGMREAKLLDHWPEPVWFVRNRWGCIIDDDREAKMEILDTLVHPGGIHDGIRESQQENL